MTTMKRVDVSKLRGATGYVSVADIAALTGVSSKQVWNWKQFRRDFPSPVEIPRTAAIARPVTVWNPQHVADWLEHRTRKNAVSQPRSPVNNGHKRVSATEAIAKLQAIVLVAQVEGLTDAQVGRQVRREIEGLQLLCASLERVLDMAQRAGMTELFFMQDSRSGMSQGS